MPFGVKCPSSVLGPSIRTNWQHQTATHGSGFDTRPGFISVWWLRKRGNIDYAREVDVDAEYVETQTLSGDLGIALRSLPAFAFGGSSSQALDHVTLLDIPITNLSMAEAVNRIVALALANETTQVCFVNADCVNLAFRNGPYKNTLQNAALVLADGIGVRLAGQLLNRHIRQNVNGTDLLPLLCSIAAAKGLGIYLLGGRPGVPEATAKWMQERCPELRISGTRNGYFTADEEAVIISDIRNSGASILLVALGAPKQEQWIANHKLALNPGVCLGVGGLFDFYSGRVPPCANLGARNRPGMVLSFSPGTWSHVAALLPRECDLPVSNPDRTSA